MITELEFLNKLKIILDRPGMFGIQKVEDIGIIFFSEIFLNQNKAIETLSKEFTNYVIKDFDVGLLNFDWCKMIRLYSGSDAHSLDLFSALIEKFILIKR